MCVRAKSPQWCPTLCNPMDCSPPGSNVLGIFQARILEWVVMPSSRGSSQPRDQTLISYVSCVGRQVLYHWHHQGSPPGNNHDLGQETQAQPLTWPPPSWSLVSPSLQEGENRMISKWPSGFSNIFQIQWLCDTVKIATVLAGV